MKPTFVRVAVLAFSLIVGVSVTTLVDWAVDSYDNAPVDILPVEVTSPATAAALDVIEATDTTFLYCDYPFNAAPSSSFSAQCLTASCVTDQCAAPVRLADDSYVLPCLRLTYERGVLISWQPYSYKSTHPNAFKFVASNPFRAHPLP